MNREPAGRKYRKLTAYRGLSFEKVLADSSEQVAEVPEEVCGADPMGMVR